MFIPLEFIYFIIAILYMMVAGWTSAIVMIACMFSGRSAWESVLAGVLWPLFWLGIMTGVIKR